MGRTLTVITAALMLGLMPMAGAGAHEGGHSHYTGSVKDTLWQNSMNVFRRHEAPSKAMFEFYGGVLGLTQLQTFDVKGANGANLVARFIIGDSQVKFTERTKGREYVDGGVKDATGLRLLSFFFDDEAALTKRFTDHGLPAPAFQTRDDRRSAFVNDPDGQPVELVIGGDVNGIEIGLTVSDMARSVDFYRHFVGLDTVGAFDDPVFGGKKISFRRGSTIVTLRTFGAGLPKDTGSGGIQYVVTDAAKVARVAAANKVPVESPLSTLEDFTLTTIWLDDPDGITNYFAQTSSATRAAHSARAE
jgi:catechol 2,3-dioxygenase-like lactoylglutathione lyase family enzyme